MGNFQDSEIENDFFSSPKIIEHYAVLQETGILSYIESQDREIANYKNLFASALDIVNRPSIAEIINATVWQISDHFLPESIVFLWKPLQNREDITIKCYKNYQLVDTNLWIDNIGALEPFFLKHQEPVSYRFFASETGDAGSVKAFEAAAPELLIPIIGPSGLYGLVLVGRNTLGKDYTKLELSYLQNLMSFVSKAIQNHLHYERTLRDPKTGLYNHGFFMTRLKEEVGRSKRGKAEVSLIIIDVDHFKIFNDTYGHLAGDRVLETLAITLKQGVRAADVASRFGGEEFTVLLPDTEKEMAWLVAERIRTLVESMKVIWEPPLPCVTISLGVFTFDRSANISADEVISRADEALYMSKAMGRNRTTEWKAGLYDKINRLQETDTPSNEA